MLSANNEICHCDPELVEGEAISTQKIIIQIKEFWIYGSN